MSQNNRKRPAPGTTPILPVAPVTQQMFNQAAQQDQLLQWANLPDTSNLSNLSANPNAYMMNANAQGQFVPQQPRPQQQQSHQVPLASAQPQQLHLQQQQQQQQQQAQHTQAPPTSTAIARRTPNRALVTTVPRPNFDPNADLWPAFPDDASMPINAHGGSSAVVSTGGPNNGHNANGQPVEEESIEVLEERAQKIKADAQAKRKQIPPFVQKLSSFLEEQKNTELIRWSENGDSFIVMDEDEFAKTLIPELFKHNNYASFVRQLNMYGFHKRVGLSDNSMKASERKNKSPSEYYNAYFRRGHPNLLWLINKPKSGSKSKRGKKDDADGDSDDDGVIEDISVYPHSHAALQGMANQQARTFPSVGAPLNSVPGPAAGASGELAPLQKKDFQVIKEELSTLQTRQTQISKVMQRLQYDNAQLQQQARLFQNMHERHENSINAILNFLANVFRKSLEEQGGVQGVTELLASILPNGQMPQGSVVDLGDDFDQRRSQVPTANLNTPTKRQQRLMLPPIPTPNSSSSASTPAPSMGARNNGTRSSASVLTPGMANSGYLHPGMNQGGQPAMGSVTELFDSPSDSAYLQQELQTNPQEGMMKIINDTNANTPPSGSALNLLEAAAATPSNLSTDERNRVLNLMSAQGQQPGAGAKNQHYGMSQSPLSPATMARTAPVAGPGGVANVPMSIPGTNAGVALGGAPNIPMPTASAAPSTSLSPLIGNMQSVPPPSLRDISNTQSEIEALQRLQEEQNAKITDLTQLLGPLSPNGRVPGVDEDAAAAAMNHGGMPPGGQSPGYFDLGQYLDSEAFGDDFNFATGDLDPSGAASAVPGHAAGLGAAGAGVPGVGAGNGLSLDGDDFNFGLENIKAGTPGDHNGMGGNGLIPDDDGEHGLFGKSPSPALTEEIPRSDLKSTGSSPGQASSKRRRVS
ncbi:heat shock transcription factor [Ophiostoma piceae UAMH 11346]|uniref:Heat shock transcription factor n=1 Tax=Ophiostoma piceae (strain UAMH 11346) TaxID=1262450 RepID=S3C3Q7_OPHP1|nr:heat shock transcription factor [Ophiostoma piceae UAMH 11346]